LNRKTLIAKIKMIELGIVPALNGFELNAQLESLSDDDRRIVKRKFRKVWRKIRKSDPSFSYLMGDKKGVTPTRSQKRNRTAVVVAKIVKDIG